MTDMPSSVPPDFDPGHGLFSVLGGEFEELSADRVVAVMDIDERHLQPFGLVHGGIYCVIVETLGSVGASIWGYAHGQYAAVGIANSTDFLRSHRSGRLRAVATPIHQGRSQQLWEVAVTRESDGKEVARGRLRLQNIVDPVVIGAASDAASS